MLADEHRTTATGLEHQPGQVAVGMQDGDDKHRYQQEGQAIGQAVLVIDAHQQHQQQGHGKNRPHPAG